MFKKIAIIGNGGMGTALSIILSYNKLSVVMWSHDVDELSQMRKAGENEKYLRGYKLPDDLQLQGDDSKIFTDVDMIISAVPCQYTRGVWQRLKQYYPAWIPVVSVTKGIENKTLLRTSQILDEVLGGYVPVCALSGPTIADELACKLPATACASSCDKQLAKKVQHAVSVPWFRVYTNTDLVGVELAGATKNVIAIAAGIIDGCGLGDNAKAALVSRGLAEISRLGVAMGAEARTFYGLAGLGDLVTTCISPHGRNRSFGQRIGSGQSAAEAASATCSVVEGASTCESVIALAERYNVEMPIAKAVYQVIFEDKPVEDAIKDLMLRRLKAE